MKAVILAAGKGTRMRELTNELPKPMLTVHGKPILQHIVEGLLASGIREIFIVTGFRADVIENHFGDGSRWGARIEYARQLVQDGTGKAPELAKDFVGLDPFLLTYGDILVRPETYRQMLDRFHSGEFSALVTATGSDDVTKGGISFFDDQFCLTRLVEKPSPSQIAELRREGLLQGQTFQLREDGKSQIAELRWEGLLPEGATVWYNAGIYIFRPLLFSFTAVLNKSPRGEYELTDAISAMVASGHRIAGLAIKGRWVDVRDPEVLAALEQQNAPAH